MTLNEELKEWEDDLSELEKVKIREDARAEQAVEALKALGYSSTGQAEFALAELEEKEKELEVKAQDLLEHLKEKYGSYIEAAG